MNAPQTSHQDLPAGTQMEEFIIEKVLGSGGFGITYLARDKRLGRKVVIKENLPAQFCWRDTHSLTVYPRHTEGEDAENFRYSLDSFEREAATLASLDHPGIVKVLRSFEANGTAYFVMPFVEGITFDDRVRERHVQKQSFSDDEIEKLLLRLLDALSYLHDRGIYHRDIKPGNILVTATGEPVLIDFGAARQRLSERSLTVIESAGYTPVEQLQSRGKVGPWSDLYALGGTLYKAITGDTPAKATDRIMDDPQLLLAQQMALRGKHAPELLASIDKAMALKAADRFQSAAEWREHLQPKAAVVVPCVPVEKKPEPPPLPARIPGPVVVVSLPATSPEPVFVPSHADWPGINRGVYLSIGVILSVISCFGSHGYLFAPLLGGGVMGILATANSEISGLCGFVLPAWMLATVARLKNSGTQTTVAVTVAALLLLPLVSVFVLFYCLALPSGFNSHRKLDKTAFQVMAVFVAIILLLVLIVATS